MVSDIDGLMVLLFLFWFLLDLSTFGCALAYVALIRPKMAASAQVGRYISHYAFPLASLHLTTQLTPENVQCPSYTPPTVPTKMDFFCDSVKEP